MSLLSSFIRNQLLKAVEEEFASHIPEMQAVVLDEVSSFGTECLHWVNEKLKGNQDAFEVREE